MNIVALVGNLTRDPELKTTGTGNTVCSFTLAVDSSRKDVNGDRMTDFISCVVWGKTAEQLCQYMRKGSRIGVTGRLLARSYEDREGHRVYVTEVVANEIQFLTQKEPDAAPAASPRPALPAEPPVPPQDFRQVSAEDLPF